MRENIAYYLLLLYLSVLFQPFLPIIKDAAAHFFVEAYHENVVHVQLGNDHVDIEISDAGSKTSQESCPQKSLNETSGLYFSEKPLEKFLFTLPFIRNSFSLFPFSCLPDILLSVVVPPPKNY